MHTVTFYSFKGGVGRTLSMVNIACSMARAGKKVLIVDLDLEAPGIETFNELAPAENQPGMVEFVSSYLESGKAPDVRRHVYKAKLDKSFLGSIHVMPAGLRDESYSDRLNAIDWQELYRDRSGFLLFEDLKLQWEAQFKPDYVFVDSRTGHTDVGGICTRQLPDQVVMLYFPNEQNLRGIERAAREIKRENSSIRPGKAIEIKFVASNVPDLDDEKRILEEQFAKFKKAKCAPQVVIHHYQSLSLLDQEIFSCSRPQSRLAKEYEALRIKIVSSNLKDREGALVFLKDPARSDDLGGDRIADLEKNYEDDLDVLFLLSQVLEKQGQFDDQWRLLKKALALSAKPGKEPRETTRSAVLREIAFFNFAINRTQDPDIAWGLLREPDAHVGDVRLIAESLHISNRKDVARLFETPAYQRLKIWGHLLLLDKFYRDDRTALTRAILEDIIPEVGNPAVQSSEHRLAVVLALTALGTTKPLLKLMNNGIGLTDIPDLFNYAIASWKDKGVVTKKNFEQVLAQFGAGHYDNDANFAQCLSLTNWVVGDVAKARRWAKEAIKLASSADARIFSAWHYRWVHKEVFIADTNAMLKGIGKKEPRPPSIYVKNTLRIPL